MFFLLQCGTLDRSTAKIQAVSTQLKTLSDERGNAKADPETQRIKRQLRKQFYPDSDDWREMMLFRSRQVIRQALIGLAAG